MLHSGSCWIVSGRGGPGARFKVRLGGEYTSAAPASLWAAEGMPEVGVALLAAGVLGSASSWLVSCISRPLPRYTSSRPSLSEHFLRD